MPDISSFLEVTVNSSRLHSCFHALQKAQVAQAALIEHNASHSSQSLAKHELQEEQIHAIITLQIDELRAICQATSAELTTLRAQVSTQRERDIQFAQPLPVNADPSGTPIQEADWNAQLSLLRERIDKLEGNFMAQTVVESPQEGRISVSPCILQQPAMSICRINDNCLSVPVTNPTSSLQCSGNSLAQEGTDYLSLIRRHEADCSEKLNRLLEEWALKQKKNSGTSCIQNLQYLALSAKVDQLYARILNPVQESLDSVDKIVYPGRQSLSSFESKDHGKKIEQNNTIDILINKHVNQAIELYGEKQKRVEKQCSILREKQEIIADQLQIALRRLQKEKIKHAETAANIRKLEEKKLDQRLIDSLTNMVKRMGRNTQDLVERKLNTAAFDEEKKQVSQCLNFLKENMELKAEKDVIKKAFIFLEDKIKEIVVLLADNQINEKDGMIKKLPFKCLSCSRDLESTLGGQSTPQEGTATSRKELGSSSHLRRCVRVKKMKSNPIEPFLGR